MDLVGELSLSVSETIRSPDLDGLDLTDFEKSAHRLKSVVREVQDAAAELRMTPVGEIFRRMRRMIRELERQTGKDIELVEVGEETQIDKAIIERLSDALIHVLRNSADHGIEPPDQRKQAGKSTRGRITLAAAQIGEMLATKWSLATALSFLVWYIFAPQCASTLAVIRRETGSWKWMAVTFLYMLTLAYLASLITYQIAVRLGAG
mgnify:CR=1 FL=1